MHNFESESRKYLEACRAAFWYVAGFSLASNLLMLAVPIYSLQVLDRVVGSGSVDTLIMLTLVVLAALTACTLIQYARGQALLGMGLWLEEKLAPVVFAQSVASAAQIKPLTGSQGLRDLTSLRAFSSGVALSSLLDAPWALIFMVVLFFIHPLIGGIAFFGALCLVGFALLDESQSRPLQEAASKRSLQNVAQLEMAARNAESLEAMGMLPALLASWRQKHALALSLSARAGQRAARIASASRLLRYVLQMAVIGAGAMLVLDNHISPGSIVAASILVGRALAPFETAIASWGQFTAAREAYARLKSSLSSQLMRDEEIALPAPRGLLEVENLYFTPPGGKKPVLKNVSFRVQPGEVLGVIGPSGAGKSTLARLLVGVHRPAAGAVRLDGAEAFRWRREDFGRYVGYVPQDIELFAGTIKENISRLQADAPDAQVVHAAKCAGVHELILRQPQGYATEIGSGGAILSGGQRQRIALARALYGSPRLLVLDEPSSNLDADGEAALVQAIQAAKAAGAAVVFIAHRPSLMSVADRILLLRDGEVAAFGPREAVFAHLNAKVADIQEARRRKERQETVTA